VRCIWHQIFSIRRIEISGYLQQQRRLVHLNIEAWIYGAVLTFYLAGTTVDIAYTGEHALYLAPSLQYNAHWLVYTYPTAKEVRSAEYCSLNMRSCNYKVYVWDYSSDSANWRMCAIFGTNFAVWSALNWRGISNGSSDMFSWILKPEYGEQ
jgi:hypothetical protein